MFEALERTARRPPPSSRAVAARGGRPSGRRGGGTPARPHARAPPEPRPGRVRAAVEVAKDAIAAGEAIQVVLARRQSFDAPPARTAAPPTGSACIARSAGSTRARTCSSSGCPRSRSSGASPELLLQVEGDRLTTHPIAGTRPRGATPAEDAAPGRAAPPAGPEGAGRARDARRPRPQRSRPRRPAGHRPRLEVHGGRALQPRPPPRVPCRGPARAGLDALDALRGCSRPAPCPARRGPGDAAHRGRGRRARGLYGGAVGYLGYDGNLDTAITIRSAVLRGPARPYPHGGRHRGGQRPGEGVRGDRAQGGGAAPGDRAARG